MFIVGLLVDTQGKKHALRFWQGATENHEVCKELLHHLESRGLALTSQTLFVIDGGKGMIKALRDRSRRDLSLISDALPTKIAISKATKKYRKEAHRLFRNAIDCSSAMKMPKKSCKSLRNGLKRSTHRQHHRSLNAWKS